MQLQDEVVIPANRDVVFNALNDPAILQASIPGCEEIVSHSNTDLEATVVVKFGAVKAQFKSNVELDPSNGPGQFTLSGNGDAGVAGLASGKATVTLTEVNEGTALNYTVDIDISGKLAQLGSRLVESTSKKLARQFFVNFEQALAEQHS